MQLMQNTLGLDLTPAAACIHWRRERALKQRSLMDNL